MTSNSVLHASAKLGILAALLAGAIAAQAVTITGRVVKVADGDTITVLDSDLQQHKIRLAGIDSPERKQDFGERARLNLARMVAGRMVTVETGKLDRYGRSVGIVLVGGKDANLAQVQAGMAWWYRAYAREQSPADQAAYSHSEENARASAAGYGQCPSRWRHGTGGAACGRRIDLRYCDAGPRAAHFDTAAREVLGH